ncbi:hypothetical protein A3K29_04825 [Candidatus Collierbacteria bacterium RIFOXYB2_FULL_46_14]|uniref:Uncharacterized protein n=1 Tax=Candidatus Collierbacteria bacterium GW2011_GWA2_46_26 TaxID=1618381 RepID=A0A0G1SIH2_9BACT|nr:MAG: hypothetical protein UX47_C0006G0071 [Candidatus Collierbacteria bacterium GW2011_GWA2_46_26]OGD73421.1 MAG: hypothetical protein A3K29_04825 [Candidatus Collierbacteria bacterium RIFOXYB2_FULL_46_14]OGD76463.1 MAG: hypothetical protein A3K43_04825 [Candidatus Collierbacteria bacterium RIFOXYA2_FULL_46_20]OGD77799.1 MAG: hypothetical protein A3K39_04825 [Candidatus Collierbacteria bacterium RIFOXYC2_FULL_43_15]OGD81089.1 MAG: hypothetical protein A2320_05320 [Pseudomonadales bacterium G
MTVNHAVELGEEVVLKKDGKPTVKMRAQGVSVVGLTGAFDKSRVAFEPLRAEGGESGHRYATVVKEADLSYQGDLFGDESVDQSRAERYYERWKYLKSIGIPVVSSMRVVDSERVLMGDMLADGGQFIGKDTYWWSEFGVLERHRTGQLTDEEKAFLQIDPLLVKQEIARIFDIAWMNGVLLPDSDEEFTVLVKPNGVWRQVMVKDYGTLRWVPQDMMNNDTRGDLRKELVDRVDEIRNELTRHDKHLK